MLLLTQGGSVAAVRALRDRGFRWDPAALDAASWPADATELRLAPDEVLLLDVLDAAAPEPQSDDPSASSYRSRRYWVDPASGLVLRSRFSVAAFVTR